MPSHTNQTCCFRLDVPDWFCYFRQKASVDLQLFVFYRKVSGVAAVTICGNYFVCDLFGRQFKALLLSAHQF